MWVLVLGHVMLVKRTYENIVDKNMDRPVLGEQEILTFIQTNNFIVFPLPDREPPNWSIK